MNERIIKEMLAYFTDSEIPYEIGIQLGARLINANVPNDYASVLLVNSPCKDTQETVYATCDKVVSRFGKDIDYPSLYLYSQATGTGKTTTACALLNEYVIRRYLWYASENRSIPQCLGYYVDLTELQVNFNMASMSGNREGINDIHNMIERYKHVELLVLDDLGTRSVTDAFKGIMYAIIDYRVSKGLRTLYTSNEPLEQLKYIFDERLYDRIRDKCIPLIFEGESKRGKRKSGKN